MVLLVKTVFYFLLVCVNHPVKMRYLSFQVTTLNGNISHKEQSAHNSGAYASTGEYYSLHPPGGGGGGER